MQKLLSSEAASSKLAEEFIGSLLSFLGRDFFVVGKTEYGPKSRDERQLDSFLRNYEDDAASM